MSNTTITTSYTNWKGKRRLRTLTPLQMVFGSTKWHPDPQWLIRARDEDIDEKRAKALKIMHEVAGKNDMPAMARTTLR